MFWEQSVASAVQSLYGLGGAFFDFLFLTLTFLAEETFLMAAVFLTYWCINKKLGEYLMLSLFASMAANGFIKDVVRRPRPFLTDGYRSRYLKVDNIFVNTAGLEHSFSFPSGHSQCAGGLWTALALWFKKPLLWLTSAVVILGVMTSRVYLGVHFPSDVLVGAALGIGASILCWFLFNRFYEKRIYLFAGVVILLLPACLLSPSADTAKTVGVGIGALAGLVWEHRIINFHTGGLSLLHVVMRMALGAGVVLALQGGLKLLFPQSIAFDALRYVFVGVAATGIVPWLFVKLKL